MSDIKDELRARKQEIFLKHYAQHGIASHAARAVDVSASAICQWRKTDETFDALCDEAFQDAIDKAEYELRGRGMGIERPVLDANGNPIPKRDPSTGEIVLDDDFNPIYYTRADSSDSLLALYIKAHRAEYREKTSHELTGKDGKELPSAINVTYVLPEGKTIEDYDG